MAKKPDGKKSKNEKPAAQKKPLDVKVKGPVPDFTPRAPQIANQADHSDGHSE